MSRTATPAFRLLVLGALAAGLVACDRQQGSPQAQGRAEQAGARIDQVIDRAGEELNKLADKTGEQMQTFGRRLEQEAEQAQRERDQQQATGPGGAQTSGGN